ncbi:hypothetical protein EVAR_48975_1 [Eumeta japonica]|uniref:Uncharacterized protein n=1 Tax=Eumeta variegata TaxID=151549 RepID=A0A4C1Y8Y1_EUMVA|nr:hypothetical protein EVAR_48975_1 [Eumeta japonica]
MKDASELFFNVASSHPNPLLVSAVSYEPPPPHNFCRRPRKVLIDPPDDLTVEVEKLIELIKMGSYTPTALCRNGRVLDEVVTALCLRHCRHKLFKRFLVRESRTHLCARTHGRPIIGFAPPSPPLLHGENYKKKGFRCQFECSGQWKDPEEKGKPVYVNSATTAAIYS